MYVAEISANHLGRLDRARDLVVAASQAGATAVKLQTYTADTMTLDLNTPEFSVSPGHELWGGRTLYSLYQEAYTPWEWHQELFDLARSLGLVPFSTPFDISALEFLESIDCPIYKIASLETGDLSLIEAVAATQKPIIISTGATTWDEIKDVVETVRKTKNENLTLLVCTSSYPAEAKDSNLARLKLLREEFKCNVGLSDHTLGIGASIAAVSLGATVIEKHLTLRRSDGGADGAFSMEPEEFATMVLNGNEAFSAIGTDTWIAKESENESRRLRRSLYVVEDLKKGEILTNLNIRAIRPGFGMAPKYLEKVLGQYAATDIARGTPLSPELFKSFIS